MFSPGVWLLLGTESIGGALMAEGFREGSPRFCEEPVSLCPREPRRKPAWLATLRVLQLQEMTQPAHNVLREDALQGGGGHYASGTIFIFCAV